MGWLSNWGRPTKTVSFAMGVERLVLMLESLRLYPLLSTMSADVYVTAVGNCPGRRLCL